MRSYALADRLQGFEPIAQGRRMNTRAFKGAMIDADKDIGLAFFQCNRRGRIGAPHNIGLLRNNRAIMGFGSVWMAGPLGSL
jgi:hypothetical protein